MSKNTDKISVCLIAKNAAKTLNECLEALREFDEIILLENESEDETLKIAENFQAKYNNLKIYKSEFIGFGPLKNKAISYAKNEWVLNIDCDEILEKEAIDEINKLDLKPNFIYSLNRKNHYGETWVKACGWWPDYVLRLFNKNFTKFNENLVHESVIVPPNATNLKLEAYMKHYTSYNITEVIYKMNKYTDLSARELFARNKKCGIFKAILRFNFRFFKDYFLRSGYKYGYKGFFISFLNALGSFFKYLKLYELNKSEKKQ